jgi:hypothetical protein
MLHHLAAPSYWQRTGGLQVSILQLRIKYEVLPFQFDDLTKVDKIVVKSFMFTCSKMFHKSASSYVGFKQYLMKLYIRVVLIRRIDGYVVIKYLTKSLLQKGVGGERLVSMEIFPSFALLNARTGSY